jgi:hypothetical protein
MHKVEKLFLGVILGFTAITGLFLANAIDKHQHAKPKSTDVFITSRKSAQSFFDSYNDKYFGGTLPPTVVVWQSPPDSDGYMGQTICDLEADGLKAESCTMYISPKWNVAPVTMYATIIHESCHEKTYTEFDDHGPRWQHCMLEQAMSGGFKGIW